MAANNHWLPYNRILQVIHTRTLQIRPNDINNNKSSATAPVAMKQTLGRQVGQEMMTPR